ncbi:21457_t:CDS:1, partial [Racocetra persica]
PKMHEIFKYAPEITQTGFNNIYACYDLGVAHLQEILRQDVYKVEPRNTVGCKKHNLVVHKLLSLLEYQKKEIQINKLTRNSNSQNSQIENNNVSTRLLYEQTGTKCQRRAMNDNEKKVLEDLLKYDTFPEDKAIEILRQLQEQSNDWDMQRVQIYWNNNHHNKKKKFLLIYKPRV